MKEYLIYDARYSIEDEDAIVLEACNSLKEGLKSLNDWSAGSILVEYDMEKHTERIVKEKDKYLKLN